MIDKRNLDDDGKKRRREQILNKSEKELSLKSEDQSIKSDFYYQSSQK